MDEDTAVQTRRIRDVNMQVRAIVERETLDKPFWVAGLVRRVYQSDMGHLYFNLHDGKYSIPCMLPAQKRAALAFTIVKQMELEVFGTLRVYDQKAKVEIEVEQARLINRAAAANYVEAEEHLKRLGLWPRTPRPLPKTITAIGLVTSKRSDALHDFEDTYRREGGTATIQLVDVALQGQQAPREIADAVTRLNLEAKVDVIALVRGGGRAADLMVFDDYLIAEAICRSAIPVVTGIGHQRDETFADRVADVAAITPTDAALRLAKGIGKQRYRTMLLIGVGVLLVLVIAVAIFWLLYAAP